MAPDVDPQASDDRLVEAAQGGDVRALERLLERHQAHVLRVLRFMGVASGDREDVAQEVFLKVFRHLGSFRPGQPFQGWIYRVSVNAAHDWRTRRGRRDRAESPWEVALDPDDHRPGPAETMDQRELRLALTAALETLSDRERCVFVLRELEGLETVEVARTLQISTITVRRHLFQARRRLRRQLQEKNPGEVAAILERMAGDRGSHG